MTDFLDSLQESVLPPSQNFDLSTLLFIMTHSEEMSACIICKGSYCCVKLLFQLYIIEREEGSQGARESGGGRVERRKGGTAVSRKVKKSKTVDLDHDLGTPQAQLSPSHTTGKLHPRQAASTAGTTIFSSVTCLPAVCVHTLSSGHSKGKAPHPLPRWLLLSAFWHPGFSVTRTLC